MTQAKGRGATASRPSAAARTLEKVREILEETCAQDGRPPNLQELSRRKAYRAGINRALAVIAAGQHDRP